MYSTLRHSHNPQVQRLKQANRMLDDSSLFAHAEVLIPTGKTDLG